MKKFFEPNYNYIVGVSKINDKNKWRAYINESHIGTFDTKIKAITARLTIEDIFKNVLSKLDVDVLKFNRDDNFISIEVTTDTAVDITIHTNILYPNSNKKAVGGTI